MLSQIWGGVALATRVGMAYAQSKFPDAKTIRYAKMFAAGTSGASYYAMNEIIGAAQMAIGGLRSTVRSTRFGTEFKKAVAVAGAFPIAGLLWYNYKEPADFLPLIVYGFASASDYSSQGRYQRALLVPALAPSIAYAVSKDNYAMILADMFSTSALLYAINKHDIFGAAGKKTLTIKQAVKKHGLSAGLKIKCSQFRKDFKASSYGLWYNAPTAANIPGQTSTDIDAPHTTISYIESLKSNNPGFESQEELLELIEGEIKDLPEGHILLPDILQSHTSSPHAPSPTA